MNVSLFKTFKTSREFTYRYYYSAPVEDRTNPTILFLHGFPSIADSWHKQATFFIDKGFGVLGPDLLGYGGTDKPADIDSYRLKLIANDVVEIVKHEAIEKVVAVGHDW